MINLQQMWYEKSIIKWLFLPLTLLFFVITKLRRLFYHLGFFNSYKPEAIVVVVGNISVGGNGKTPAVITLADHFSQKGYRVGILSRGYGGNANNFPHSVLTTDHASLVGDEPLLLANRTGLPVVIDPRRVRGANHLVEFHQCNLIICDDGLQHYALQRDIEIVVMDGRNWGNGWLLPMGPLREQKRRLNNVDLVIHNTETVQDSIRKSISTEQFSMTLLPGDFINLVTGEKRSVSEMALISKTEPVTVLAGIGNPSRFFKQLEGAGIDFDNAIGLPDHHDYVENDIPNTTTLMTEKDAVKVVGFAHKDCWYQRLDASLPEQCYQLLNNKIHALVSKM